MDLLLVLRGVLSCAVQPRIQVVSFSEYLANLKRDGRGRKVCNVQTRILLQKQGVERCIDIIGILIS